MTHAESWSITPTAAHGRKAPTNNCKKYIGQNKSGKSGLCLATQPYITTIARVGGHLVLPPNDDHKRQKLSFDINMNISKGHQNPSQTF